MVLVLYLIIVASFKASHTCPPEPWRRRKGATVHKGAARMSPGEQRTRKGLKIPDS